MNVQETKTPIYLKDYKPTPYLIPKVDLDFQIYDEETTVTSKLRFEANPASKEKKGVMSLNGVHLKLKSLKLNGNELPQNDFEVNEHNLNIFNLPDSGEIETVCTIEPHKNLSLEGLYKSGTMFCTQCEAEGFRKITYHYDRPDIMSKYTVRVEADKVKYPVLLSNGNCKDSGDSSEGRHFVAWEDPFLKPSYLFALVAGNLTCLKDSYITKSGRKVDLEIYTYQKDADKCDYAMLSLKNSMKWDEDVYNLECDLDHFKIVAVGDFNMGAMENKGLNIFNTALVLAKPDATRDETYQRIMEVVGHEYFHNWTGNRVTCRDWFQLCLKEGLTVFRDQEFTCDMFSRSVKRIEDVRILRQHQWPEDDGPLSHPPRPNQFFEINNFYTSTVYNKGAEVVRMLATIIGEDNFYKGMKLYFERHDGQAVCQEDFVAAMADASKINLDQFMLWYTQAGTPTLHVEGKYSQADQSYKLTFRQTHKFKENKPVPIPVTLGLIDENGEEISLQLKGENQAQGSNRLFTIKEPEETLEFVNVGSKPVPSLLRKFSAAVRLKTDLSFDDLVFLMKHDKDSFCVWDAAQTYLTKSICDDILCGSINVENIAKISETFGAILNKYEFDPAFKALVLMLPSEQIIAQEFSEIPVGDIHKIREEYRLMISEKLEPLLWDTYTALHPESQNNVSSEQMALRSLKNTCLWYLNTLGREKYINTIKDQFQSAQFMTDTDAALGFAIEWQNDEGKKIINDFYDKWQDDDLAIDRWFARQASSPMEDPQKDLIPLLNHKAFKLENPNRMRAVLSSFCVMNPTGFHHESGFGYQICREYIEELNKINRQMAASLAKTFNAWRRYPEKNQKLMQQELRTLLEHKDLASDVYEIVNKALQ